MISFSKNHERKQTVNRLLFIMWYFCHPLHTQAVSSYILLKKVFHHLLYTTFLSIFFLLRIPILIFNFDTAFEGSRYPTQQKMFGNIIWKSVKFHFWSIPTFWNFKCPPFFSWDSEFRFVFKSLLLSLERNVAKKVKKNIVWKKSVIFDQKLLI